MSVEVFGEEKRFIFTQKSCLKGIHEAIDDHKDF
jgi:hypothetical protein